MEASQTMLQLCQNLIFVIVFLDIWLGVPYSSNSVQWNQRLTQWAHFIIARLTLSVYLRDLSRTSVAEHKRLFIHVLMTFWFIIEQTWVVKTHCVIKIDKKTLWIDRVIVLRVYALHAHSFNYESDYNCILLDDQGIINAYATSYELWIHIQDPNHPTLLNQNLT